MKIKLITINILFILCYAQSNLFCHKEWVHQHIVKEAYKLLYNEVGTIDPLYKACGFYADGTEQYGYDHNPSNWQKYYPLLRGAYVEDCDDILLDYRFWTGHWSASDGHFWTADQGDFDKTYMYQPMLDAINAFDKARRYYSSLNSIKIEPYNIRVKGKFLWGTWNMFTNSIRISFRNNLVDFINEGDVVLEDYKWRFKDWFLSPLKTSKPHLDNIDEYPNFSNTPNKFVYGSGIAGRICHLLADMSVPAHVHGDLHPCYELLGLVAEGDYYELHMGHGYHIDNNEPWEWDREDCDKVPYQSDATFYSRLYYNQTMARQKSGIIWEVFQIPHIYEFDILHYLFYTLNQLSEVFPSKNFETGNIEGTGNKNLVNQNNGQNPYLNYRYSSLNPSQDDVNEGNVDEEADELYNYAIRATATLMYWLSWELGWLDHNPLCRKDNFYLQCERIFGHHINKQYNNLEFKVEDYSHTPTTGKIIAGKNVHPNPIIPEGDVIIDPSVNLSLTAAKEVVLKDGFKALRGSNLHARIENVTCYPAPGIIASNIDNKYFSDKSYNEANTNLNIYPNPVSNSTEIRYSINEPGNIRIMINDVYGNLNKELINRPNHPSGIFQTSFNTIGLPAGIYFVIMKTQSIVETRKMVIIR